MRLGPTRKPRDSGFGRNGEYGGQRYPLNGEDGIRPWAESGHNLGVRTGKQSMCFVLDFDPRNGGDRTLAALTEEHGELPRTYTVASGRGDGGLHFYWRLPEFEVSSGTDVFGPGADVKGEASYVVAPGSVHEASGGLYEVVCDAPIAQPPVWVVEHLRKRAGAKAQQLAARRSAGSEEVEKVSAPPSCCESLARTSVARIARMMDRLAEQPEGGKVAIPNRASTGRSTRS